MGVWILESTRILNERKYPTVHNVESKGFSAAQERILKAQKAKARAKTFKLLHARFPTLLAAFKVMCDVWGHPEPLDEAS